MNELLQIGYQLVSHGYDGSRAKMKSRAANAFSLTGQGTTAKITLGIQSDAWPLDA
jgi:hypothetical protein